MPNPPIGAQDLAAALTAFSIEFAAAIMSPHHQTPNELLEALANQLHGLSEQMSETPARTAIEMTSKMLMASETER